MRVWGRGAEGEEEIIHRMNTLGILRWKKFLESLRRSLFHPPPPLPPLHFLPPYTCYVKGRDNKEYCIILKTAK